MPPTEAKKSKAGGRKWLRRVGFAAALLLAPAGVLLADAWSAMGARSSGARLARMRASPEYADGHFVNALPVVNADGWSMMKRWFQGVENSTPATPPPVIKRSAPDFAEPPASGLRITWFGHSSMLVEIDGHRVLTDPVWGERCSPSRFLGPKRFFDPPMPLEALPKLDAVVLSHDHYDHLDAPTILALESRGPHAPRYIVPLGVGAHLEHWGVPADRIVELDWWEEARAGDIRLVATPARHFSGRGLTDASATLWAGWAMIGAAHRVFFSGDTGMFPGFVEIGARLGPFDATMIEVGAYDAMWADVHLGPEQAVRAHQDVRGRFMFPVHWGTFDLAIHPWTEPVERLMAAAARAKVPIAVPKPGESVEPASYGEVARWWPPIPWRTADEAPVRSSGLE
jgi:L-ascorbate metabolism protein UlaG (beta-lactamase superfamily)